jgi:hypothetical protein
MAQFRLMRCSKQLPNSVMNSRPSLPLPRFTRANLAHWEAAGCEFRQARRAAMPHDRGD